MIITKTYETIINLSAKDMYLDIDNILLIKLKSQYENKCEKNSLIIKILDIVKRSNIIMSKSRLDGSADVSIQFRASSIIYNENDILTGCEVQKIDRGNKIICKHENAVININGGKQLVSLRAGQFITIKVISVSYIKGVNKITVYGSPYSYSFKFYIYNIKPKIFQEDIIILKSKLQEIEEELILHKNIDIKHYNFFNETLYPYKIMYHKAENSINMIELTKSIIENNEVKPKLIARHPIIDKNTTDILVLDKNYEKSELFNLEKYKFDIIDENIAIVLLNFLNDYLMHIRAIREMTEIYKTEKDIEQHSNIWNIYQKIKR